MELLLNLCWMALSGLAIGYCSRRRQSHSFRYLIVVACFSALLFPVISASDDLRAAQQEMEDATPSKRILRQAGVEKGGSRNLWSSPPALASSFTAVPHCDDLFGPACDHARAIQLAARYWKAYGRAPPSISV